jgi:hypothetical protein
MYRAVWRGGQVAFDVFSFEVCWRVVFHHAFPRVVNGVPLLYVLGGADAREI